MTQPPEWARYGTWLEELDAWAGEWFASDADAAKAERACRRSGEAIYVRAARDGIDDTWLDDLQV